MLGDSGQSIRPELSPELENHVGHELITTDGTTLLGADDKAGVAEIMAAAAYLVAHPEVPHGTVKIAFNPDEEIGRGVVHFPVESFGAVAAYTVDGSTAGELQTETFSGAQVRMRIHGRAIHPGWASGELVNAIKIAGQILARLPQDSLSPETTEGREGYVHPVLLEGDSSEVELRFIVRDFDDDRLAEHIAFLSGLADDVCATEPRCTVEVEHRIQYRNPRAALERYPQIGAHLEEAIRRVGLEPKQTAIRGGTDGSALTEMGLPSANIFTGGHDAHSGLYCPARRSHDSLATGARGAPGVTQMSGGYSGLVEPLLDRLGRPLETLRISITDRCNFRCVYCMPKEVFGRDYAFLERRELLTLEELARVVGIFAGLGVRTVRITGGEPLVRRNVEHLVELLAAIHTPDGDKLELALTTNGSALAQKASALAAAGLSRVTVSLDSLDDAAFRAMNDVDFPVQRVLEGIDAAAAAGLPVKVNAVVKRGANDGDVLALAEHFRGSGHVLRFIEYMDVGSTNGWRLEDVVSAEEIILRIGERWPLEPVAAERPDATARRWRYVDGAGEVGVVASVTQPFCGGCSRARLSAEGRLYTCLFAARGHDLRAPLRLGASDEELTEQLRALWTRRTDRYSELRTAETASLPKVEMSYIGG